MTTITEEIAKDGALSIRGVSSKWLMTIGILTAAFGVLAVFLSAATTLLSILFIGALLMVSGFAHFAYMFTAKEDWKHSLLHVVLGVLYIVAGGFMFSNPVDGAIIFTGVLACAFILNGVSRMVVSFMRRFRGWGVAAFSGFVTAALGLYILMIWPLASFFILGLLVGLDLIFFGFYLITLSTSRRTLETPPQTVAHKPAYT